MARLKFTAQQVADALTHSYGIYAAAARSLRCDRETVKRYVNTYAICQAAARQADTISDIAEGNLVAAVLRGDIEQSKYWLEAKARDRGYGRQPREATALTVTSAELAALSDAELDALAAKLDRLTR